VVECRPHLHQNQITAPREIVASINTRPGAYLSVHVRDAASGNGGIQVDIQTSSIQPEGLSVLEACKVSGLGRTTVYEAISDGRLKARKFGKRTIILRGDLRDFLTALPVLK